MSRKKTICIISFPPIYRALRQLRQIKYLSPYYDLIVAGYGPLPPEWQQRQDFTWEPFTQPKSSILGAIIRNIRLIVGSLSPRLVPAYKPALEIKCDAYIAHDWKTLPIAVEAARKNNAYVVLDAHEYAPLESSSLFHRLVFSPLSRYVLHKHAARIDAALTVAPRIAEKYQHEFKLDPLVVLNATERLDLPPKELDPRNIRLVHHGGAAEDRRLEAMIETIALCDRCYSLHFMFLNHQSAYAQQLQRLAESKAPGRVTFHPPVAPHETVKKISEFDIGFYLLAPTSFNNMAALPNKFFDFIIAGLAVCIAEVSVSMADIVRQHKLGVITPSIEPQNVADTLNQVSAQEWVEMQGAARRAAAHLNAAVEMKKVLRLFVELFEKNRD